MTILPQPAKFIAQSGSFDLNAETAIVVPHSIPASSGRVAEQLTTWLRLATGYPLPLRETVSSNSIRFELLASPSLPNEGYRLEVGDEQVVIQATAPAGFFYAAQSLRQLLPPEVFATTVQPGMVWRVPGVWIEDAPRLGWRGAMLDTVRHYMPVDFIKSFLDLLALHKLNVFHWHLTDDQGWRLEIERYPRLTEVGAWRSETLVGHLDDQPHRCDGTRHGGFYTQADVREIVSYAAERHITVIPEIEMPGHATAAIAAYPELGNRSEPLAVQGIWGIHTSIFNVQPATLEFLKHVLDEVLTLFPSKFIHIGGDEAPKKEWRESPSVQEQIQALGLEDEHQMQSYVIKQIGIFLSSHGRHLIGWDEILEGGLAEGATVMSWRGEAGGIAAAKLGHDVVMAPGSHTYLDHYQVEDRTAEPLAIGGFTPLEKAYAYEPIPKELSKTEARHVLGAQAQLWTEYMPTPRHVEFMAFPRLCALADVFWTPGAKDYAAFLLRLEKQLQRFDQLGVNYRPPEALRSTT